MVEKLCLIRGNRVLQILNEVSTPQKLERNIVTGFPTTTKRQYVTDPVRIVQIRYTPTTHARQRQLRVDAVVNSGGKKYDTVIQFAAVTFQENDAPTNITFVASDNETYNILPISLSKNNVKVRCTCLDFYHRFATWNFNDTSLYGKKPAPYRRKTTTRPPVNPLRVPGMCKHIIKTFMALQDADVIIP